MLKFGNLHTIHIFNVAYTTADVCYANAFILNSETNSEIWLWLLCLFRASQKIGIWYDACNIYRHLLPSIFNVDTHSNVTQNTKQRKRKAEQQQQQKNKTHVNQFNCWWWQTNIRETTLHLLEFLLWWILYQNIIPIIVYKIIPPATATLFHRLNEARVLFSHNVKMYFWFCSTTHRLLWPNERERASNREKWERSNQRPMK